MRALLAMVLLTVAAPAAAEVVTTLTVRETAGVARRGEVATGGVPLPRRLGLRGTEGLAIVDARGRRVAADFRVLARWNAGRDDAAAPLQWVLVSFPATVEAGKSTRYRLVAGGAPGAPAPHPRLRLTRAGRQVVVSTGAATFRVGGHPEALFNEVRGADGALLVGGSSLIVVAGGQRAGHPVVRSVRVESAGPLRAVVVVEGEYGLPPLGGGRLSSQRRYEFTAGSPTAVVRQAVRWEGSLPDRRPNGWRLDLVRDRLGLPDGFARQALVLGARSAPPLVGPARPGPVRLEQARRPERKAPRRFTAEAGGEAARGEAADGGVLAVGGPAGTVAVALARMHRYEPQALRLLADDALGIDLAGEGVWLAHHQGLFATLAVAALPPGARREDLERLVWAPLNRPLRPWPDAAWFAGSQAVDELPAGKLPAGFEGYDGVVKGLLERTLRSANAEGLNGLMTFGLLPRAWGQPWGSPELDCKRGDPTPGDAGDNAFWCGTWTDYHNTLATVPVWAMRSGEVEWLDELAFPGALRMLHTQVMQCAPGDPWFYCGQAPAGYGGYRADFNSSHAYFENLFLYYWLTGDSTVTAALARGGESMRRRFCPQRKEPGGGACGADDPLPKGVGFTGRVASQWLAAFRFLGLAGDDATFLDDFRSGLARAVTLQYAEAARGGRRYGFLGGPIGGPGAYTSGPVFQHALYDANNLYRLQVDTGDAPIGSPPLRPSRVLEALARTVADLERAGGAGRAWPERLRFAWTGPRIGGRLTSVEADSRPLYGPEQAGAAALLVRAGAAAGDRELLAAGREVARAALAAAAKDKAPLGKVQGQYLLRLHAAVGRLADAPAPGDGR